MYLHVPLHVLFTLSLTPFHLFTSPPFSSVKSQAPFLPSIIFYSLGEAKVGVSLLLSMPILPREPGHPPLLTIRSQCIVTPTSCYAPSGCPQSR